MLARTQQLQCVLSIYLMLSALGSNASNKL